MRSRVIDKAAAPSADRWDFPAVDSTAGDALRGVARGGAHLLTTAQIDALERQTKEEARKRGYEEGLAASQVEVAARIERLTALAGEFSHPFQNLEQAVEDEVVALAIELARHLVGREVERDPALLHAAIADCLAALAASVRDVTLHLHPDDAALVRSGLPAGEQRFKIAIDAAFKRGDLRVTSSSSLVDGSIAARCREIIAAARVVAPRSGER